MTSTWYPRLKRCNVRYLQERKILIGKRLRVQKYCAFFVELVFMDKVRQLNAWQLYKRIWLGFVKYVQQTHMHLLNFLNMLCLCSAPISVRKSIQFSLLKLVIHLVFHLLLNLRNISHQIVVDSLTELDSGLDLSVKFSSGLSNFTLYCRNLFKNLVVKWVELRFLTVDLACYVEFSVPLLFVDLLKCVLQLSNLIDVVLLC